jgi:hypothetical protein
MAPSNCALALPLAAVALFGLLCRLLKRSGFDVQSRFR